MVTDYLDGAVPADLRARLEHHLAFCDGCRSVLAQIERVVQLAYRTIAPGMIQEPLKQRAGVAVREELDASEYFGPVTTRRYAWDRTFTSAAYVDLLGTHSDHRLLDGDICRRLHDAITAIIDGNGGELTIDYVTEVQIAARA